LDILHKDKAQNGPLSITIPGEIMCFKEAHDLYGVLPWEQLFEPSIKLSKEGWEIYNYTASVMEEKVMTPFFCGHMFCEEQRPWQKCFAYNF